ncbi:MAG: glycosyltransferase, partial [Pseudomonadota bacterium]
KTVLGFTGFVRDWHGLDRVLPLLKDRPDTALLIVGDGPARQDLEAQAANLGVKDQLQFTGFVEREEIPEYVAAFDVALQPDVVPYASPLKLFDYLGLAKPVVAPDTANIREVLDHGENAILFDAADPQAFARATGELLDDAKAQEALGRAALKTIEAGQYLWTANAARVISLAEKTP